MSESRRFCRWVAWNVDGARMLPLPRKGIDFVRDREYPADAQVGDELYKNNRLDRGQIARRADLVWGERDEAERANRDSFYLPTSRPTSTTSTRRASTASGESWRTRSSMTLTSRTCG